MNDFSFGLFCFVCCSMFVSLSSFNLSRLKKIIDFKILKSILVIKTHKKRKKENSPVDFKIKGKTHTLKRKEKNSY